MKNRVVEFSLKGEVLNSYDSCRIAALALNIRAEGIRQCARGDKKTYKNRIWLYEDSYISKKSDGTLEKSLQVRSFKDVTRKAIIQLDLNGNKLGQFESTKQAAEKLNLKVNYISEVLNGWIPSYKGFRWIFVDEIHNNFAAKKLAEFTKSGIYDRNCGGCGKLLHYQNHRRFNQAEQANAMCYSCASKKMHLSRDMTGAANPMYGRHFYEVWVEKYGEEQAAVLFEEFQKLRSKQTEGSNNPMFGKMPAMGAGSGWKGWYRGVFFRSLLELSYMVLLDKERKEWRSAESKEFQIKYEDLSGQPKNYYPDFLVDDSLLVEIKPRRLIEKSKLVQLKAAAAEAFCKENGLQYLLTDTPRLVDSEIAILYSEGTIKFTERYEKLYTEKAFLNNCGKNL